MGSLECGKTNNWKGGVNAEQKRGLRPGWCYKLWVASLNGKNKNFKFILTNFAK